MNILSDRTVRRLSAETARLASRYIAGEMGKGMSDEEFSFSREFQAEEKSQTALYAEAIMVIAENAPVRFVAGERLAGAATLRKALKHLVPVIGVGSISHTTLGFEKALKIGASGIRREIQGKLDSRTLDGQGAELLNAMLKCLDAFNIWCERYRHAAEELALESSEL